MKAWILGIFFLFSYSSIWSQAGRDELERIDLRIANYFTKASRFQTRAQFENLLKKREVFCKTKAKGTRCLETALWWEPVCSPETGRNQEFFEALWRSSLRLAKEEGEAVALVDKIKNCSKQVGFGQRVAAVELIVLALEKGWPSLLKSSTGAFDIFWKSPAPDPTLSLTYLDRKIADLWAMKPIPVRVLRSWGLTVVNWMSENQLQTMPFDFAWPWREVLSKTLAPFGEGVLMLNRLGNSFARAEPAFQRPNWLFEEASLRCLILRKIGRIDECLQLYSIVEQKASKQKEILDAIKTERTFLLVFQGNYPEAKRQFREVLKLPVMKTSPARPWVHYFLASIALAEGQYEEAEKSLKVYFDGFKLSPQRYPTSLYGEILNVTLMRERGKVAEARVEAERLRSEINAYFSAANDYSIWNDLERLILAVLQKESDRAKTIETQLRSDLRELPSKKHFNLSIDAILKTAAGQPADEALSNLKKVLNVDDFNFLERALKAIQKTAQEGV